MGSLSNYSENRLLDHVFNTAYTPSATIYLALCTADPTEAATGASCSECANANNYARKAIAFGAAASRKVIQSGAVTFNQASGTWGTITHWVIVDSGTYGAGNVLAYGSFSASFAPVSGNTPSVGDTQVQITFNASSGAGFTDYLVHNLLNLMFRNTAFSKPATYLALCNATVADAATSITEVSGTSYARKQVNINGGSSPTWTLASGGAISNTHQIDFATPGSGGWTQVVAVAIVDTSSGACNVLAYDNTNIVDQTPGAGDSVYFAAGDFDVSLD